MIIDTGVIRDTIYRTLRVDTHMHKHDEESDTIKYKQVRILYLSRTTMLTAPSPHAKSQPIPTQPPVQHNDTCA